jgi:hypothetical protein
MIFRDLTTELVQRLEIYRDETEEHDAGIFLEEDNTTEEPERTLFQLPPMKVLFGVSERKGFYSLALSLHNHRDSQQQKECLKFFKAMEAKCFEGEEKFSSIVRDSRGPWPPYLSLKLPTFRNGEFITKIYYDDPDVHMSSPKECLSKGDVIIPVVECSGFWKSDSSVGSNWDLIQIKLTKPPASGIYKWLYN